MSLTSRVPVPEPSLTQSSRPFAPSLALKYSNPPVAARSIGSDPCAPGRRSDTRLVPADVPRLRHSSRPPEPPLAPKYRMPFIDVSQRGVESLNPGLMFLTRYGPDAAAP